ncbi:MAG: CARDB domain-containing protein [Candidatus Eiseniibacteriota bacterium]
MRITVAAASLLPLVLAGWVVPTRAAVVLLDDQDCLDWVRTFDSIVWKQKDSALSSRSLLKFDLTNLGFVQSVQAATLTLFVERAQPGTTLLVHHVHDASWTYRNSETVDLYNWPEADLIASIAVTDTATLALNVTSQVSEDLAAGRPFSIKLRTAPDFSALRVASPLASRGFMTPRLRVDYTPVGGPVPRPDLAVSPADLSFDPMQPVATGDTVSVRARVRNNGAAASMASSVAFWDGMPGTSGSQLIATVPVPALAAGGGAATVQNVWNGVARGYHDVHAVLDPAGVIVESDESNNTSFKPFVVSDVYDRFFESFEYAGRNEYYTDFDMPPEFGLPVPKAAFMERSGAFGCHGRHQLEVRVDGTGDDGTVWIERAFPVEPSSRYRVSADWREYRYDFDMAFPAVVAIDVLDPEMEADFTFLGIPPDDGCRPWSYERVVDTGPYDHVWVAIGFSIVWETAGVLGLDSVSVVLEKLSPIGATPVPPTLGMAGPAPNPTRDGAEFRVWLAERSRLEASVYDVRGRLVRRIFDGYDGPGERRLRWDTRGSDGAAVPAGVYFFALLADGRSLGERKLVVVR